MNNGVFSIDGKIVVTSTLETNSAVDGIRLEMVKALANQAYDEVIAYAEALKILK